MKMKLFLLIFSLSLFVSQLSYSQLPNTPEGKERERIEKETKNFSKDYVIFPSMKAYGNITVSSEDLKGSSVFYIFGDSSCPPCVGLAKTTTAAINSKKYEGKNIKFVFLAADDDKGLRRLKKRA